MRLNDVVNQYATISEIAVRQAEPRQANASSSSSSDALTLAEPRQNANYERQLERAREIANNVPTKVSAISTKGKPSTIP